MAFDFEIKNMFFTPILKLWPIENKMSSVIFFVWTLLAFPCWFYFCKQMRLFRFFTFCFFRFICTRTYQGGQREPSDMTLCFHLDPLVLHFPSNSEGTAWENGNMEYFIPLRRTRIHNCSIYSRTLSSTVYFTATWHPFFS